MSTRIRFRRRGTLGAAAALAALLGGVAAAGGAAPLRDAVLALAPAPRSAAADTTVLFGPRAFDAGRGEALHVERFAATPAPGRARLLRLLPGGAGHATLTLNGRILFRGALSPAGPAVGLPVDLQAENTLEVAVRGAPGSAVTVAVLEAADPTFTVWGPRTLERAAGAPEPFAERFVLPPGAAGPFALHVETGGGARPAAHVRVNGVEVLSPSTLEPEAPARILPLLLRPGENTVEGVLAGGPGGRLVLRITATDAAPPEIEIAAPPAGLVTREGSVAVSGAVRDRTATRVTVDGQEAARSGDAFTATVPLAAEGEHTITVSAVDAAGLRTDSARTVVRDTEAPRLELAAPADGLVTRDTAVLVLGTVADRTAVEVNVGGVPVVPDGAGAFQAALPLAEGPNFVTVTATDRAGNASTAARRVTRDTQPPVIALAEPREGAEVDGERVTLRGIVHDVTAVTLTVNGAPAPVGEGGAFAAEVELAEGANALLLQATDAAGNTAALTRTVVRTGGGAGLPPDPARVASAVDRTVATPLGESTAFLYTGDAPIQTGVAPGTIHPVRAAILRGRVTGRDGRPLPGVEVSVADRPAYGRTLTRADGAWDLAVNGGERLLVAFARDGFLPAQRPADPEWGGFARVGDVALVRLDPRVTRVDLAADTVQVARGSVERDADGERRATLLFAPGTAAEMVLPDGSTRPLPALGVRATEYTVGEGGPAAMPGALPPTSAYTYAVELSADEALAAGATGVRFSRPVSLYVENFLGFPDGFPVPVATYGCPPCGAWRPEPDGRVVRVLAVDGGVAAVDGDGDGLADDEAKRAALGIDDAERAALAGLYAPGTSLWRARLTHFSPIDLNYPNGPPPDAEKPDPDPEKDEPEEDDCSQSGSQIGCVNRTLGERVRLAGTPFSLVYQSDRVPGRRAGTLRIPLTGATVPASMRRVIVEIEVAGRSFRHEYAPAPGLEHLFEWDGRDAYGRVLQGAHGLYLRVGYVYPFTYRVPAATAASFGLFCTGRVLAAWSGSVDWRACVIPTRVNSRARQEETVWSERSVTVGAGPDFDVRALQLGGWTLDAHHVYDPGARVLHMGTGRRRIAEATGPTIVTVAGTGSLGSSGDGGPATRARIRRPDRVAVAADGTLYIPDANSFNVRRVAPDGTITTVAGNGLHGFSGDGGPARQASFSFIYDAALGPDGSLYIADWGNHRVRRVGPDGIVRTVAGNGGAGYTGDGGPATGAEVGEPWGIAVAPDHSLFIASGRDVIRKVSPGGVITTVAGTGTPGYSGDGGLAAEARLAYPDGLTIGPDGSLYIEDVDNGAIRRVTPDGIITTVAGGFAYRAALRAGGAERRTKAELLAAAEAEEGGGAGPETRSASRLVIRDPSPGDGGPATETTLATPFAVAVGRDGTLYIAEANGNRIRVVSPSDTIATIAGLGFSTFSGDGGPALAAGLSNPWGVSIGPDGSLYISDSFNSRVRRMSPPLPGFGAADLAVASEDGRELFQFSAAGRHLRTLDARTGAVRLAFGYDGAGRLVTVADGDGGVTRIERDGAGDPTAVVGPDGHRSALAVDAEGYLARVEDPSGRALRMEYAGGGLLARFAGADGQASRFEYQPDGTLRSDTDAAGGVRLLARLPSAAADATETRLRPAATATLPSRLVTAFTTPEGRTTRYLREILHDGTRRRTVTSPGGLRRVTTVERDGTTTVQRPDGGGFILSTGPDPRFGMEAPVSELLAFTPAGRVLQAGLQRGATLAQPGNPLTLTRLTTALTVNGNTFTSTWETAPRRWTSLSPLGRRSTALMDAQGRTLRIERAGTLPWAYAHDARGRLLSLTQGDRSWRLEYDGAGRVAAVVDPLSRRAVLAYDAAGRLTEAREPGGRTLRFGYDAAGRLASVAPEGRGALTLEYTEAGRLARRASAGDTTTYAYDRDGRITRLVRPGGGATDFDYDTAGRLLAVRAGDEAVRYEYEPGTGMLAALRAPDGTALSFTHDGVLPLSERWEGAVSGTVERDYDNDFRVSAQRVGGAHEVDFRYDRDGLLVGAGALELRRDPASGFPTGSRLGAVESALRYDAYGQVTGMRVTAGAAVLLDASYTLDALGRVTARAETSGGATVTHGYRYDEAGRLVEVTRDGAPEAGYAYDAHGNRVRATTAAGDAVAAYDGRDRLLSQGGTSYTYTSAGEVATRAAGGDTARFAHDALGRLRGARLADGTEVEYVVDPRGRRVGKRVDGALVQGFLYDRDRAVVAELDGAGAVVSRFVYASRAHVPDYMVRGGRAYRIVSDPVGSVRLVVDAQTGAVAQRIDYDAFGRVVVDSNPGFQPFGFAGGLYDRHTGLVRFGARDYDPEAGRWTSRDPAGLAAGTPHPYEYAGSDPVNWFDDTGRAPKDKLYGLPKDFWRWYHRNHKQRGDPDISKPDAEELHEWWKENGRPDPEGHRTDPEGEPSQYCPVDPVPAPPAIDLPDLPEETPCIAAGVVIGGIIGGVLGAAGGTLALPGGGTYGGAVAGWSVGGSAGGAIAGSLLGGFLCNQ